MRSRRFIYIALGMLIVLIGGIAVAYALLSSSLTTTFSGVTQSALSWNVGFTGSSVTPTAGGTSATGRTCGTATVSGTSVSVAATTLSKPGDSCAYALTIKNSGTIGAKLATITPTNPTGSGVSCTYSSGAKMICNNISYHLSDSGSFSGLLSTGRTLVANASMPVYLFLEYIGTDVSSTSVTQSGAKFTLTFNQE